MNAEIVHRGPDDAGVHVDPGSGVALGARRLSIIDLADGHQPVINETGTVAGALNGEIYNFESLREELLRAGHRLRSRCDTEVLVHLYEEHGPDMVHALEGMYAFVIWDAQRRRLLAARDRFGEKPLFYVARGRELVLASEATALTRTGQASSAVSAAALDEYFVLGYVQAPRSIFAEIRQLPPAHLLTWSQERPHPSVTRYWSPPAPSGEPTEEPFAELVDEAEELLARSMRGRLHADVPVGLFLSGGVDSALVGAFAADQISGTLKTFTVGYDVGGTSEAVPARALAAALHSDHHELVLTGSEMAVRAPATLARLDQPLADQAFVPLHLLAAQARREVTVVVGGEGSDELFGGYPRVRWMDLAGRMARRLPDSALRSVGAASRRLPAGGRAGRFAQMLATRSLAERHLGCVTAGRPGTRASVYGPALAPLADSDLARGWGVEQVPGRHAAADLMRLDQTRWLPDDVLAKADRATMLTSLEMRTPFLHRELGEFAASLPAETHLADDGKAIVRALVRRRIGPEFAKRAKRPFAVPVGDWLRGSLGATLGEQVAGSALYRDGWFAAEPVGRLLAAHRRGEADHSAVLWPLFSLGCWWEAQE